MHNHCLFSFFFSFFVPMFSKLNFFLVVFDDIFDTSSLQTRWGSLIGEVWSRIQITMSQELQDIWILWLWEPCFLTVAATSACNQAVFHRHTGLPWTGLTGHTKQHWEFVTGGGQFQLNTIRSSSDDFHSTGLSAGWVYKSRYLSFCFCMCLCHHKFSNSVEWKLLVKNCIPKLEKVGNTF